MSIRKAIDGSFWIPRKNPKLEVELDSKYDRVEGSLKWWPKSSGIEDFTDKHKGEIITIIGKGVTLDKISDTYWSDGIIICLNEAGNHLKGDNFYTIIKDKAILDIDTKGTLFVSEEIKKHCDKDAIFYNETLSGYKTGSVILDATALALKMGAKQINYTACDGIFKGDIDYAEEAVVQNSYSDKKRTELFVRDYKRVLKLLGDTPYDYYTSPKQTLVDESVVDFTHSSAGSQDVEPLVVLDEESSTDVG